MNAPATAKLLSRHSKKPLTSCSRRLSDDVTLSSGSGVADGSSPPMSEQPTFIANTAGATNGLASMARSMAFSKSPRSSR